MSMAAKPEKQSDSEEERKRAAEEEEESEAAIKRLEQAEAEFDSLVYGKPNMSESEQAAEATEREKNRKMREDFRVRQAEHRELRNAERKMRLETRQEKLSQEGEAEYKAKCDELFGAEWDAFLLTGETKSESGTRDQELASKSISETAAPRQQKRPRCLAA